MDEENVPVDEEPDNSILELPSVDVPTEVRMLPLAGPLLRRVKKLTLPLDPSLFADALLMLISPEVVEEVPLATIRFPPCATLEDPANNSTVAPIPSPVPAWMSIELEDTKESPLCSEIVPENADDACALLIPTAPLFALPLVAKSCTLPPCERSDVPVFNETSPPVAIALVPAPTATLPECFTLTLTSALFPLPAPPVEIVTLPAAPLANVLTDTDPEDPNDVAELNSSWPLDVSLDPVRN